MGTQKVEHECSSGEFMAKQLNCPKRHDSKGASEARLGAGESKFEILALYLP
jgi:hypothetical protein